MDISIFSGPTEASEAATATLTFVGAALFWRRAVQRGV